MVTTDRFHMFGQREIYSTFGEPFATAGDSGSLVFMLRDNKEDDLVCIGMVVGTSSHDSCIMTPIENVLNSLNLPMRLTRFDLTENRQEEATGGTSAPSENTLQLILASISDIKQQNMATKQSIDDLREKTEMRFISLERQVKELSRQDELSTLGNEREGQQGLLSDDGTREPEHEDSDDSL